MSDPYTDRTPYADLETGTSRDVDIETDDGPHGFTVTATKATGFNSGRRLYRVECITCFELIHPGTTGPDYQMRFHVRYGEVWPGERERTTTPEEP
jgi:hypothetical protein